MDAAAGAAIALAGLTAIGLTLEYSGRRADRGIAREQLNLLRQQLEAEAAARLERTHTGGQRARLAAMQRGTSGSEHIDRYDFEITNAGPAAIFNLRLWAAGEGHGTPVLSEVQIAASVLLAQSVRTFTLEIPREQSDAGGLRLWAAWTDDAGETMQPLLDIRPLR